MASPQRGTGLPSVITGLLVAVAAVVPLVWFTSSQVAEPQAEDPATTVATVAREPEPVVETIVVAPDPVEVDGLSEAVVRTLEAAGNVRKEGRSELGLPESIIAVLADHDVVLRVAEEETP